VQTEINTPATSTRVSPLLFGLTILLSAFLLFQVQPLIAKLILPWFGGSAAVWTSCMLFFQIALLGGYAYAHWLNGQPGARQTFIHSGMLAISFLSLPIVPAMRWKPAGGADPLLGILGLLTATVGLPYFLLSSTSPLLQSWYSRANGGAMPWRFFALSNLGSMLGLLTYPVLVEPNLTNRQQAWMWSGSYIAFVLVCSTVAFLSRRGHIATAAPAATGPTPTLEERLIWIGLAACASALLLAVTNHLTQNVAAIPFLWVLPLSLYLLSFILCFDSDRWYRRWLFGRLGVIALPSMAYAVSSEGNISDLRLAIAYFCTALFVMFMVCHGELAKRRPAPFYLTSFYLMVSVGGAIGGLLIGLVAPYLFSGLYDLPVVLSLTGFLLLYLLWKQKGTGEPGVKFMEESYDKPVVVTLVGLMVGFLSWRFASSKWFAGPAFLNGPYDTYILLGLTGLIALYMLWRSRDSLDSSYILFTIAAGLAFGMTGFLARDTWNSVKHARVRVRNFYGALLVYDNEGVPTTGPYRVLRHGTIDHGEQFLWPQNQRIATTYYTHGSGLGVALLNMMMQGSMTVGSIGLGAGTTATYARPIDHYFIYDINPAVLKIATEQFTFLRDCMAPHEVIMGDARLQLESEAPKHFDLLAVDAFSGDAIPVHLLTREAFQLYWRHLQPNGVLAVHVSNKYLSLGPVVDLAAKEMGKKAMMVSYSPSDSDDREESSSDWVLVTSREGFFDQEDVKKSVKKIEPIQGLRPWTDDYSNLYRILKQ
jgi:spermidine synthase